MIVKVLREKKELMPFGRNLLRNPLVKGMLTFLNSWDSSHMSLQA